MGEVRRTRPECGVPGSGPEDLHRAIREDLEPQPITLRATMDREWYSRETPYKAVIGEVGADQLARWYGGRSDDGDHDKGHGERLCDRNVRKTLGLTGVSQTMAESMLADPEGFLHRHNGITVQCDKIRLLRESGSRVLRNRVSPPSET
ncbi:AIPR family protein [Streptomyces sp. NPDC059785]|uniref:AIPR family protein n=1 Tax=Streptomyces sp. NPDC059785 TaxID=3346945 RepID=UPI00365F2D05